MSEESNLNSLFGEFQRLQKVQEELDEKAIDVTARLFKLSTPLIEQLKRCVEEKNRIISITISNDTSDSDKIKEIRDIILRMKVSNSKIHLPEETLEDDLLKDKTNKEAFNILVSTFNEKLVEYNNSLSEIGKVIAETSLADDAKIETIKNLLAAS